MHRRFAILATIGTIFLAPQPVWPNIGLETSPLIYLFAKRAEYLLVYYRPTDSPWLVGYTTYDFTEEFGNFGDVEYEIRIETSGPFLRYLFNPNAGSNYYLSSAVFRREETVTCLNLPDIGTISTTSPFFGGGFMPRWRKNFTFTAGLLFSSKDLSLQTDCVDEEANSLLDATLNVGITFQLLHQTLTFG